MLATNHGDGSVRLWNAATGELFRELRVTPKPSDSQWLGGLLSFAPDGIHLLVGVKTGNPSIWNTTTGRLEASLPGPGALQTAVGWSSNGMTIVTGPGPWRAGYEVRLYDARTFSLVQSLRVPLVITRLAVGVSPDGKVVVGGGCATGDSIDRPFPAQLAWWHLDISNEARFENAGRGMVACLGMSSDGRILASGTTGGELYLWDCVSGKIIATLAGHPGGTSAVAFSPDPRTLVSTGVDHKIRLWNVATGRELFALDCGKLSPGYPSVSADGKRLAVSLDCERTGAVAIWSSAPTPARDRQD
jgi:WD40 repeat protein